jgi:hypothetical protein
MAPAKNINLPPQSPTEEYTVFAMSETGEVVGQSGNRVNQQELIKLIDELLDNEEVSYVEVHDGSCSVRL